MLLDHLPTSEPDAVAPAGEDVVIDVRGLHKSYEGREVVRGLDLQIRRGELVAVLGPNGAGKTTTVSILEGFRDRDSGEVSVLGVDPAIGGSAWRERLGVVLQDSVPEPELTVREMLELHAGWYAAPRDVEATLELVGLAALADRRGAQLSGGERRRLDVALALIGDPELVFLDEPTTGFDPAARRAAWTAIEGLRDLGVTVVLTTHYLEEAERLADRIVVLVDGAIRADGTPATLGGRHRAPSTIALSLPPGAALPGAVATHARDLGGGRVELASTEPLRDLHELGTWVMAADLEIADLEVRRPTLEDVYLELTAR